VSALPGAFLSTHALDPDKTPHLPGGSCAKFVKQHPVKGWFISGHPMRQSAPASIPAHGSGFGSVNEAVLPSGAVPTSPADLASVEEASHASSDDTSGASPAAASDEREASSVAVGGPPLELQPASRVAVTSTKRKPRICLHYPLGIAGARGANRRMPDSSRSRNRFQRVCSAPHLGRGQRMTDSGDRRQDCAAANEIALLALSLFTGCLGSGDDRVTPSSGSDAGSRDGTASPSDSSADVDAITADDASTMSNDTGDTQPDAPPPACPIQQTNPAPAGAATSAGFSGTDAQYYALYNVACQTASDCSGPCVSAGGTTDSCTNGSACVAQGQDGGMACLPPTYWLSTSGALSESGATASAAQLILVMNPYDDALALSNFGISIPDGSTITGIQFKVRRATLTGLAVDESVRILKGGTPVGANRAQPAAWPMTLDYGSYGGAYDTWGTAWTPADLRSTGFGISIAPKYTGTAGNERAYIDSVRVTVFYTTPCD
jgi:hypothetical protein